MMRTASVSRRAGAGFVLFLLLFAGAAPAQTFLDLSCLDPDATTIVRCRFPATGAWNVATAYAVSDVVFHQNLPWVARRPNVGVEPVEGDDWQLLAAAGATGAAGPVGPQGPRGPQGPQGIEGSTGAEGPQGPTGPEGSPGPEGAAGPRGEAGAAGPAGSVGPAGPAGVAGPEGATGPRGVAGAVGPQGPQGPAGPAGPQGDVGPAGPAGPAGDPGPAGAAGPQGAEGPQGAPGERGSEGPVGAAGPIGPAGAQGTPGPQGAAGMRGETGPPGARGPAGPALPELPQALRHLFSWTTENEVVFPLEGVDPAVLVARDLELAEDATLVIHGTVTLSGGPLRIVLRIDGRSIGEPIDVDTADAPMTVPLLVTHFARAGAHRLEVVIEDRRGSVTILRSAMYAATFSAGTPRRRLIER